MLQDAAVLQYQFPLFPLWQHPIFCDPNWRPFADQVLIAHNTAEEPMDMRIRNVLPDLEETVRAVRLCFPGWTLTQPRSIAPCEKDSLL